MIIPIIAKIIFSHSLLFTGLPHTQDNLGYFEVYKNLGITDDVMIFFKLRLTQNIFKMLENLRPVFF